MLLLAWWLYRLDAIVALYREQTLSLREDWADVVRIAVAQQIAILHRIPDELHPGRREELETATGLLRQLNRDYPPRRAAPARESNGQRFHFMN